ncbi:7145_t:CDS:2 [Dentiscutata erythropus]|uniref:7145_t:CDS:1 n=1 Tax=Dentiscutata erythropus TaxID=1348616 RepID=A0A9N9BCM8_9GLOM|nr:7145_t:CDS:2 [Dentiscutata erythropus]
MFHLASELKPLNPNQIMALFRVYIAKECQPKYIKKAEMQVLGTLKIDLSKALDHPVKFWLTFGTMEIKATDKNKPINETYHTTSIINS